MECPFPPQTYRERLNRVYSRIAQRGFAALYLPPSGDLEYLTGFRRRRAANTDVVQPGDWLYGALIVPYRGVYVVSPYMTSHYVREQVRDKPWISEVLYVPEFEEPVRYIAGLPGRFGLASLAGFSVAVGNRMWTETFVKLQTALPGLRIMPAGDLVAGMRRVKDRAELELMRRAAAIADEAFAAVLAKLRPGVTELDAVTEVDYQLQLHGAEWTSFPTSVVFAGGEGGAGARDPGDVTGRGEGTVVGTRQGLAPGMHASFDFGAVYKGYCSDFGRTVFCGEPAPELARVHSAVMEAQAAGMAAMKADQATGADADAAARGVLTRAGYGELFWHRLGHGIGCDVHEPPFLTRSETSTLEGGMTFTVEPSVHRGREAAVRVEDVVLVTAGGGESLNRTGRELTVVG